ncbi:hypothetical protein MYSTI_04148 [Myxococcus stipitatus DSM 14675]|uniref:Uncharacterized protein n=1 Tax=Myxococcus stipitatus (strain DSM 14675 / JCM 12634 / Mx s8) TaxID=1278073 RepID=L7UBN7_MYXSD|nr:hypothetical protein [Myxococcus stipitatus]AGC45448.1 hypothetical protein MYSTI_04148 [Myxococcus stipitatus DSM 14675]
MSVETRAQARTNLLLAASRYETALRELRAASELMRDVVDDGVGMDGERRELYAIRTRVDEAKARLRSPALASSVDFAPRVTDGGSHVR